LGADNLFKERALIGVGGPNPRGPNYFNLDWAKISFKERGGKELGGFPQGEGLEVKFPSLKYKL